MGLTPFPALSGVPRSTGTLLRGVPRGSRSARSAGGPHSRTASRLAPALSFWMNPATSTRTDVSSREKAEVGTTLPGPWGGLPGLGSSTCGQTLSTRTGRRGRGGGKGGFRLADVSPCDGGPFPRGNSHRPVSRALWVGERQVAFQMAGGALAWAGNRDGPDGLEGKCVRSTSQRRAAVPIPGVVGKGSTERPPPPFG